MNPVGFTHACSGTSAREISLKPWLLDERQSQWLDIADGSSGLYLRRLCFEERGAASEFDQEHWRAGAVEVLMAISAGLYFQIAAVLLR